MEEKRTVALTGGIGSGKSYALRILEDAGYETISSDKVVKDLYEKRKIKLLLKKLFPTAVKGFFNPVIDRNEIAIIVFSNADARTKLTNLITPLVMEEIKKRVKKLSGRIFVEVPLLFECGYQNEFDAVMVVTRDFEERVLSVIKRSNMSREQVLKRINSQFDYQSADLSPYTVIVNDGKESFKEKILSIAKTV